MESLSDNWIDLAAAHGSTKWVQNFIRSHLPQLKAQHIAPDDFAQSLDEELQARKLSTPAQQKNYRSNVVQALKSIDPSHPANTWCSEAISLVSPTAEEYRELNDAQRGKLADRETRYFTSDQAQALVDHATALLESAEWSDVGAGLAVLVGRRISEILLSSFSLKSDWSLSFSEMAKKAETSGLTIEIPTLAPAEMVLSAIERLQKGLRTENLKLNSLSPKMAKQTVNQRFSDPVAAKCVEHFSDLVPARSDRENLYTHIFRACYATIAAHWFCPPNVPEHSFKAEIQGHFTLTQDGKKLPNFSARANYDDYAIGTPDGNRDGRLGIKLGTLPGLHIIDAFRKDISTVDRIDRDKDKIKDKDKDRKQEGIETRSTSPEEIAIAEYSANEEPIMPKTPAKPKSKRPEIHADDWEDLNNLMAQRGVFGSTADLFHALIEAFKLGEFEQQQQQTRTVGELTSSLNWFTDRIDRLEKTCAELQQERDQLKVSGTAIDELEQLRSENVQLKQELQQTRSQLQGIQKLLGIQAHEAAVPAISTPTSAPTPVAQIAADNHTASTPAVKVAQQKEPKAEAVTRRNRGETIDKISQIVDALLSWNTSQEDSGMQLRISIPTIKGLASAMGANYQPAIQEVLKERSEELEEHHSRLMIGTRHNAGVSKKDEVLRAISRDYLGLENWSEVRY